LEAEMTMRDYNAAREVLSTHGELADFAGPRDEALVARAEQVLALRFPPTYRQFLREFGAGSFGGTEIYGVIDDDFDASSIPDGIWNALEHRRRGTLGNDLYEFYAPGDGEAVCLDFTSPGEEAWVVAVVPSGNGKPHILFDDFGAWLMEAVEDELEAAGESP
jgi:hypothetical protein